MSNNITFKLNALTLSIDQIANDVLKNQYGVSYTEYLLLLGSRYIPSASQKSLVGFSGLSKGMVSRVIQQLFEKNLITFTQSLKDKRLGVIILTIKGKKLEESASTNLEKLFRDQVIKKIPVQEINNFEKTLDKLIQNLKVK